MSSFICYREILICVNLGNIFISIIMTIMTIDHSNNLLTTSVVRDLEKQTPARIILIRARSVSQLQIREKTTKQNIKLTHPEQYCAIMCLTES